MTDHAVHKGTGEIERPTFATWLLDHRHGVADLDLTEALRDLIQKVSATRKPGSLTIKLNIKAEGDMLAISDSLTVKEPNLAEASMYWIDRAGDLSRHNPLQPRLPFNEEK